MKQITVSNIYCSLQVDAITMKEFFDSLPASESDRICEVEYFDEYEEWHQKCFHYVLVLARSHGDLFVQLEQNLQSMHQFHYGKFYGIEVTHSAQQISLVMHT